MIDYLLQQGKTLRELVEIFGVDKSAISLMRSRKRGVSLETMEHVETKLGVPYPVLMLQAAMTKDMPAQIRKEYDKAIALIRRSAKRRQKVDG